MNSDDGVRQKTGSTHGMSDRPSVDQLLYIMREYELSHAEAIEVAKLTSQRYESFMMGYSAALEDVAEGNIPPEEPQALRDHVRKRCSQKHTEWNENE